MGDTEPNGTPAAPDAAGQRPTDGNQQNQQNQPPTPPTDASASGQQSNEGQQSGADSIQNPEAKKYADEAAKYRKLMRDAEKERDALRAEKQALADKDLSEKDRAEKRANEAEQALATERATYRQRIVRAEVRVQAAAVGIKPELAAKLIDTSEIPAEADDEEMAKEIAKLLKQLAKDNPELVRTQASGQQQSGQGNQNGQQPNGGTPNPGATSPERQLGAITVTANQYLDKTFQQEFKQRYGMSVQDAVLQRKAKVLG